jgi:hypothetical protein
LSSKFGLSPPALLPSLDKLGMRGRGEQFRTT